MRVAAAIEAMRNLAQYDYDNRYYDFHNDYNCEKVSYADGMLLISLKGLVDGHLLLLEFAEVKITLANFFKVKEDNLTIDLLYRGRAEFNGELVELLEDGSGYFYLEFYEGQRLEFWAKSLDVKQEK